MTPAMVVLVSILFMLFKLNCDAYMVPKSLHTVFVLDSLYRVMSDINDDDDDFFVGPAYLEDYDLFPYNTEHFAHLDIGVQLQWCAELKQEVLNKIHFYRRHAFNAKQKKRIVTDLYEKFYVHVGAEKQIRHAILHPQTKFNGMH